MNKKRIPGLVGLVLILLLVSTIPASANPNWIRVDVVEVFCTYEVGEAWVEGDMYYERGSVETGFKLPLSDDDPFPYGTYTVDVNLALNLATGEGTGYGDVRFDPDGYAGAFTGWWHGTFYQTQTGAWLVKQAHANTDGVGDAEGWRTKGKSYSIDTSPYAGMCGGYDPFGASFLKLDYKQPK
jgi:hypothetical protein